MRRARSPHLLAVHDEAVAVENRARAERRQVAAGTGLAHAEASAAFAAENRHRVVADLLVVAVVEEGRDDDAEALRVRGARNSGAHQLLEVHERLDRSRVASTAVRRPSGYEPTGVEHAARPRACPTGEVRRPERRLGRDLLDGRRVLREPAREVGAERFDSRVEGELHATSSAPAARTTSSCARAARWATAPPNSASPVLARFNEK